MATLKAKDIRNMGKEDRDKKIKELKLDLIKTRANATKTGSSRAKQIKKIIARILTINKSSKREELNKK